MIARGIIALMLSANRGVLFSGSSLQDWKNAFLSGFLILHSVPE